MDGQHTSPEGANGDAGHRAEHACAAVEGQLAVLAGREDVVAAACTELGAEAARGAVVDHELLGRLAAAVAGSQSEALATPVFELVCKIADGVALDGILPQLLEARVPSLRSRIVDLAVRRLADEFREEVLVALATTLDEDPRRDDRGLLGRLAGLLESRPALLEPDRPPPLRRLAARVRDRHGEPAEVGLARNLLGVEGYAVLAPYLDFTRASVTDIVALTPVQPPPCIESVAKAEKRLGRRELCRLLGELGWNRVTWGLELECRVGLAAGCGLPLIVSDAEAEILGRTPGVTRTWERWLAVAHGATAGGGAGPTPDRKAVERFRGLNVLHAEMLTELMTMAPLNGARARRLLEMTRRLVDGFGTLFAGVDREAARVAMTAELLTRPLHEALSIVGDDESVPAAVAHTMLAFEDPDRLDEVATVHGLKRFLHQRGLRSAARLFHGASGADRTVDIAVWQFGGPVKVVRRLSYVDLEPDDDRSLPIVVRLAVEAYSRHLLHGLERLPDLEAFCCGNEVQAYINFRNHPAFLRVDLAPPLRGGMLEIEYFAISQYELEHHPNLELPAIREAFAILGFDLEVDGVRLRARYDKERALDIGQLVDRVQEMMCLVPYLMDLDWTIGGLDYPFPVRIEVARAWARRLRTWGVLPIDRMLTANRRRVAALRGRGPGKEFEIPWDGHGEYCDALGTLPADDLLDRLRATLAESGFLPVRRWPGGGPWVPGQLALERTVLDPVRDAVRAGDLQIDRDGLHLAPPDRAHREHEAVIFAQRLHAGGESLQRAMSVARLVRPVEPHLRFRCTGTVGGHSVEEASLWFSTGRATVAVLRDADGATRLAVACDGGHFVLRKGEVGESWQLACEIPPGELERRLRRDAFPVALAEAPQDESALVADLRRTAPRGIGAPFFEERAVSGVAAAPGRAVGPVRLGTTGRRPEGLDGAVLVAASVTPDDAPLLQHAAAIVSTGGGVLSHAGLIALELGRPSLVVEGSWHTNGCAQPRLHLAREVYHDEVIEVGGFEVVCHRGIRVFEEELCDGDLVEVDADRARLVILGRDAEALAVWAALNEMQRRGALLAACDDDAAILAHRGRMLRAVHQLERLAERLTSATLIRFLIWELLVEVPAAAGVQARPAVRRVLEALQTTATSPDMAFTATAWCVAELERRLADRIAVAHEVLGEARTPFEPLLVRADVYRLAAAVAEARELAACGIPFQFEHDLADLDAEIHGVLEGQRARAIAVLETEPADPVTLRSALHRLKVIERVSPLSPEIANQMAVTDARLAAPNVEARAALHNRWLVDGEELTVEAAVEVGGKAAALGELQHTLGTASVPPFFAVTRSAFRRVLETQPGTSGETLERKIRAVLEIEDGDEEAAAHEIRRLWEQVTLPEELEHEITDRVQRLEAAAASPLSLAVRSSGFEEDTTESAWAGQFDSFLGVVGVDEVLRCLRLVWASLWTERALVHRRLCRTGGGLPGGGVIVQRMVVSRVAGVIHTVAVAAGRPNEMIVNVGLGLGAGVVAGTVEVDHVVVAKSSIGDAGGLRFRYAVGAKRDQVVVDPKWPGETRRRPVLAHQRLRPALEYRELGTLVATALRLEEAWGEPLDIEFAFEGPELKILQARPVPAVHNMVRAMVASWPLEGRSP